jgi:hypothetical protein
MSGLLWTEPERVLLKTIYLDHSKNDVLDIMHRPWSSIKSEAFKLGLKRKRMITCRMKPGVNHTFFDTWSNDMAYVLGFIAADGCVASNRKSLAIKLAQKDQELLERIRDLIAPAIKLRDEYRTLESGIHHYTVLAIGSTYICRRLMSLGIGPRKSLTMVFPNVPDQYVRHFIRGYFDGDGCISKDSVSNAWSMSVLGTEKFLKTMGDYISSATGIGKKTVSMVSGIYRIRYAMGDSMKIYRWMYDGGSLYLARKRHGFEQLISERGIGMRTLRVFTEEEDEAILNNIDAMGPGTVAKMLHRSYDVIRKRAKLLSKKVGG